MSLVARAVSKVKQPRDLGAAVLRRLVPNSARHGFPWLVRDDGSVTFQERGFVAAASPSALLARHNYETARIRRELDGQRFRRSLEIGCGYGRLSMTFAEHSDEHVAVDINADALATARTAYPHLTFEEAAPGVLDFPDHHFDVIYTWTVIQHVPPSAIEAMCDQILRALTPSGTLLICEETREPGSYDHTWHRTVGEYQALFAPLKLKDHGYLTEIDAIPGMVSPGEVMHFVAPTESGS
jgi:SAM-dependent methyltransferase